MLDRVHEQLIRLHDVPDLPWLPRRRAGKTLHVSTVIRWAKVGAGGGKHKLWTCRAGGALATTETELRRFFERRSVERSAPLALTPVDISHKNRDAEVALDAAGII